jgi:2-polyprenyl-3-methyl-5-hydroxy-6-metoxy-1,4-benzoquinol methylase
MLRKLAKCIWGYFARIEWLWNSTGFRRLLWKSIAQKGELKFHQHNEFNSDEELLRKLAPVFERYGYGPDEFNGKVLVDIGAGSHLVTRYFKGAHIIAVEPLADKYMATIKWCKLKLAKEVYSVPAEERLEKVVGRVDFAICSNVLDHCFDPQAVVNNMYAYLKPGGRACIAVDCHEYRDPMHQLLLNEESLTKIMLNAGFKIEKLVKGLGPVFEGGRQDFGHGNTLIFRMNK